MPKETRYALAVIASVYLGVIALAKTAGHSWALWLLALPLIGALQNHLLLLHHEGAHGLLHPTRAINDLLANLFCGFPFFELLRPYRDFHFSHHRHVTSEQDPELPFYHQQGHFFGAVTPARKIRAAFLDLCGYHWLQFFFSFLNSLDKNSLFSRHDRVSLLAFGLVSFLFLIPGFASGVLWFWLVPQLTFTFYFAKCRGLREHGKRMAPLSACTKNINANLLERLFIFPLNSDQHLAHHENTRLRWYEYPR